MYKWYVVQTIAGQEERTRALIEHLIATNPSIRQTIVPVQDTVETRDGKQVIVERKLYPGYVLVCMTAAAIPTVTNVQGVVKIMRQPLTTDPPTQVRWRVGQLVHITTGPFAGYTGTIEEVLAKGHLRVAIALGGRLASVQLDPTQVE